MEQIGTNGIVLSITRKIGTRSKTSRILVACSLFILPLSTTWADLPPPSHFDTLRTGTEGTISDGHSGWDSDTSTLTVALSRLARTAHTGTATVCPFDGNFGGTYEATDCNTQSDLDGTSDVPRIYFDIALSGATTVNLYYVLLQYQRADNNQGVGYVEFVYNTDRQTFNTGRRNTTAPTLTSIERAEPTDEETNANRVTFQVTFSESVEAVDTADFVRIGTAGTIRHAYPSRANERANISPKPSQYWRVAIAGLDLQKHNGEIGLELASSPTIIDLVGNALTNTTATGTVESYTISNTELTIDDQDDFVWTEGVPTGVIRLSEGHGGNPPYTYSLTGSLPAGITYEHPRVVKGTPTAAQAATTMTWKVTDSDAAFAQTTFDITVQPAPGLTLAPSSLTITEGSAANYTIQLDTQPTADVEVRILRRQGDDTHVTFNKSSLDFTSTNWDTPQTVTVNIGGDLDTTDDSVELLHRTRSTDADYGGNNGATGVKHWQSLTVNETDLGAPAEALAISAPGDMTWQVSQAIQAFALPVATGGQPPYAYDLDRKDGGTLASLGLEFSAPTRLLSGTPSQEVTDLVLVYTVEDARGVEATDEFSVTVNPEPTPGVTVSTRDLSVSEGDSETYTVVLDSQPTGNVTIAVAATGDASVRVTPANVSFSMTDWESPKTFTVFADEDDDTTNDSATISHTVTSTDTDYSALTVDSVSVATVDDDTTPLTATLSVDMSNVNEGAGATQIQVTGTLSEAFLTTVTTLTVSVDSGPQPFRAVSGVDFAPVQDFDVVIPAGRTSASASFTLTPTADIIDEPNERLTVSATSDVANVVLAGSIEMNIVDDDPAPSLLFTLSDETIDEAGGTTTLTVSTGTGSTYLGTRDISLALSGTATENVDFSIGATTLTLPAGNGATTSQVTTTITALDDNDTEVDETIVISGFVRGNPVGAPVRVTIEDDDEPSVVSLVLTPSTISEGGSSTISATVSPTIESSFTVTVSATAEAPFGDSDFTLTGATLSFAAGASQSTGSVTLTATDDSVDTSNKTVIVSGEVSSASVSAPQDQRLTILDDDETVTLSLTVDPAVIAENGGSSTITIGTSAIAGFQANQTIGLSLSGVAQQDVDYSIGATSFTPVVGSSSVSTTLTAISDDVFEGDETVSVAVLLDNVVVGLERSITIVDDDAAPSVTLVVTPRSVSESGGESTVTATLSKPSQFPFTITVSSEPLAPATAAHFTQTGSELQFSIGATTSSGSIKLTAVDDQTDNPDRQVHVSGTVSNAFYSTPDTVLWTILDDDASDSGGPQGQAEEQVVLSMALDVSAVSEGDGPILIHVSATLDEPRDADDTRVSFSVGSGTGPAAAMSGEDFAAVDDFILVVPAGQSSASGSFTLTPIDDNLDEVDETLVITGRLVGFDDDSAQTVSVTIRDNDTAGLTLSVTPDTIAEDGGTANVLLGTSTLATFMSDQTVTLSLSGTATIDEDYTLGATSLTLEAGRTSVSTTLTGLVDGIFEGDETVGIVALLDGIPIDVEKSVTITDAEERPDITLVLTPSVITEGGSSTVSATIPTPVSASFMLTVGARAEAPFDDRIFSLNGSALSFAAGATESTGVVTVEGIDDSIDSDDKTVVVSASVSLGILNAPEAQRLTIRDNDDTLTLSVAPTEIAEDGGESTITISTNSDTGFSANQVIELSLSGFAQRGEDYAISSTTLIPVIGQSTVSATVTGLADDIFEGYEIVNVAARLNDIAIGSEQSISIIDGDSAPDVTLVVTPPSVVENGGESAVTATLSRPSQIPFSVAVSSEPIAPNTADDFTQNGSELSFPINSTASTGSVTLVATDDQIDNPDKQIRVTGTVSSALFPTPDSVTWTIRNDDTAELTLSVAPDVIAEDGGTANVTVSTSNATSFANDQTITLTLSGTATSGQDYEIGTTTLTLLAGASSVSTTLTGLSDKVFEGDETAAIVGLRNGMNIDVERSITIVDSDDPPEITLVLDPPIITENGGTSQVTATLSNPVEEAFELTIGASAVSPAESSDFTQQGMTLSFDGNQTRSSGSVSLMAVNDQVDGPDKEVSVEGHPSNSLLTSPAAKVLTISDDDAPPTGVTLSVAPNAVREGAGTTQIIVTATIAGNVSAESTLVQVNVGSGTATVESDFRPVEDFSISIPARSTMAYGMFYLFAVQDEIDERNETVLVQGSTASTALPVTGTTISLVDDDETEISIADSQARETATFMAFDVSISRARDHPLSISYSTYDASARDGLDYEAVSGQVTIPAGQTSAQISVPLILDSEREGNETFTLLLSDADGAVIVDGAATGTIVDTPAFASESLARISRLAGEPIVWAVEEQVRSLRNRTSRLELAGRPVSATTSAYDGVIDGYHQRRTTRIASHAFPAANEGLGSAWDRRNSLTGAQHEWGNGFLTTTPDRRGWVEASDTADLLGDSSFHLVGGPADKPGLSLWGRGHYTQIDSTSATVQSHSSDENDTSEPGNHLGSRSLAHTAIFGADFSWVDGVVGVAASQTRIKSLLQSNDETTDTLEATVSGFYPYFGWLLNDRFAVWGVAGQGAGDQVAHAEPGSASERFDIASNLAGLGVRAELIPMDRDFSLAIKSDAIRTRARFAEKALERFGLDMVQGEWQRTRVGFEASWQGERADRASIQVSFEGSAVEDVGDAENGRGFQLGGRLHFDDHVAGLSISMSAQRMLSHDVEAYKEFSGSMSLKYDPEPESAVGPSLFLNQVWKSSAGLGIPMAAISDSRSLMGGVSLPDDSQQVGMAWGIAHPTGIGLPWAAIQLSGDLSAYRLGYRAITARGIPSLELGTSELGREFGFGWESKPNCMVSMAIRLRHLIAYIGDQSDTSFEVLFRSLLGRSSSSCIANRYASSYYIPAL